MGHTAHLEENVITAPGEQLLQYLKVGSPTKRWARDRVLQILTGEAAIPSFSAAALKLGEVTRDPDASLEDVAAVISMDPGLATRCLHAANSAGYGGRGVATIQEAVLRVGMAEIRRIAFSVGVMDRFSHLRVKVDWNRFWLHSILVARLTEKVAAAFRQTNGTEYLAGLLHDAGKLLIEHHFPREFELVLLRSMERRGGHASVEAELLGLDHTQIGAAICERLQVGREVLLAVWHHHDPVNPALDRDHLAPGGFLTACVAAADALANIARANFDGARIIEDSFEALPEWQLLTQFECVRGLDLDLAAETKQAEEDLRAFGAA